MNTPAPGAGDASDDRTPAPPAPGAGDVHRMPPKKSAYRRWFSTLNPAVQLVFCQLWMPTFMCVMFVLVYVGAFQHAAPREVPVGVIGGTQVTRQLQQAADEHEPGTLNLEQVADHDTAREKVKRGDLGIAYDVAANQLIVASAHQAQAVSIVPKLITPLLPAVGQNAPPATDDVAPLPAHDIGMTPMYLTLAWCISGYLAAMFIGLMGGPLRRMTRFAIIAGVSGVLSLLSAVLADLVLGAITGHFWALWGLGFCWAAAIGTAVNGLSYFAGRFIAAPSMLLFIFLSIPSSGAAMPIWMMPEIFQWLNNIVVGSGISEMLKHLVYGVGPGYSRGWRMLACYLVIGLLLTWAGRPYWEWKRVRRLLSGRRTMFQDAQRANGRRNADDESEILASYGLEVRESDGALVTTGGPTGSAGSANSANSTDADYRTQNFLFSGTLDPKLPDYGRDDSDDSDDSDDANSTDGTDSSDSTEHAAGRDTGAHGSRNDDGTTR
ncbi:ABC transporter permease [Corynebacterium nuruki]|uniref:ABC transporter permease n=1 Tax=Corynebacterium nuruki TaxID=1032851 RepID=UPI00024861B1|nr:ABC transporter permease [Corynebacterium nuruki]